MHTTPISLLERLRSPEEAEAWDRFVYLYTPLLFSWARGVGLQPSDAGDLVQDVFALLLKKLPEFQYDRQKSFRAWLRQVTLNKWRERCRNQRAAGFSPAGADLDQLPSPEHADAFWEREYRQRLVGRALELMQKDFKPATWRACWEHVVSGKPAAAVASELGLTVGAVYAAKFRVLARLRQELKGLLE
jgi:RNA polymerase sigma-70 factor (ECF subfamily)